jgi:hypothetical protein
MKSLNNLYILLGTAGIMGVLVMDFISIEYFLQTANCIKESTDIECPSTEIEEKLVDPGRLLYLTGFIYLILYELRN